MRVADNHRPGLTFTPPQHSLQPQFQQQTSTPNQQPYPVQTPLNMNTPIRAHHHPPAVHQMYSANGDAYAYNSNQPRSPNQNNQNLYSPNMQQTTMNYVDGTPLPGGRQPLYANAPPKPRRLNSSSGVEDEMAGTGEQRDTDNTDDDGGFAEHTGYPRGNRRSNPAMATATYQHPRGANQATIVDDAGNVFNNQVAGAQMYKQQMPNLQHNQPQHRHRYNYFITFHNCSSIIFFALSLI